MGLTGEVEDAEQLTGSEAVRLAAEAVEPVVGHVEDLLGRRRVLDQEEGAELVHQGPQELPRLLARADQAVGEGEAGADVPLGDQVDRLEEHLVGDAAEQPGDVLGADGAARVHDCLLEQAEDVPHRARCPRRQQRYRRLLDRDALRGADVQDAAGDGIGLQGAELVALAAVQDGLEHLGGLGRRKDEDDVGGGLLQHLEEGVVGGGGEHVALVEDVDLPPPAGRGVGHLVPEVPGVVHRPVGGGIDLDDVQRASLGDVAARGALVARFPGRCPLAVERLGQDPGRRGLARPPRPAEQAGMRHSILGQRILQRRGDMALPHHISKRLRPITPI